jgi:UDP-N-acetylglucosamine 2-epimerase
VKRRLDLIRIVGARPQFMQAAVLRRELDQRGHKEILVHTGQHYDDEMSRVFFEELGIPEPDGNLGIGSGAHGAQTGRMLEAIEAMLARTPCDAVVVDGDTNSTLAGALAAAKLHIPVVHVEAGMRSFDRRMPEEVNRVVTDHIADLLCAPTAGAAANLKREGLGSRTVVTGDLMYDCLVAFQDRAREGVLSRLELEPRAYILATVHRAENTDAFERLRGILAALAALPLPVILPVHPRTRAGVETFGERAAGRGALRPVAPVGYLEMLALERHAQCILTDSGGVQREAFCMGVPTVILRDTTEWRELIEHDRSVLAGWARDDILAAYQAVSAHPHDAPVRAREEIFGDGHAAARVAEAIEGLLL